MYLFLLIPVLIVSIIFMVLGFTDKAIMVLGISGILLLAGGFWVLGDGLHVADGNANVTEVGSSYQVRTVYTQYTAAGFPSISVLGYGLVGLGLFNIFYEFKKLRARR